MASCLYKNCRDKPACVTIPEESLPANCSGQQGIKLLSSAVCCIYDSCNKLAAWDAANETISSDAVGLYVSKGLAENGTHEDRKNPTLKQMESDECIECIRAQKAEEEIEL